jgi:hypothetical protein
MGIHQMGDQHTGQNLGILLHQEPSEGGGSSASGHGHHGHEYDLAVAGIFYEGLDHSLFVDERAYRIDVASDGRLLSELFLATYQSGRDSNAVVGNTLVEGLPEDAFGGVLRCQCDAVDIGNFSGDVRDGGRRKADAEVL